MTIFKKRSLRVLAIDTVVGRNNRLWFEQEGKYVRSEEEGGRRDAARNETQQGAA